MQKRLNKKATVLAESISSVIFLIVGVGIAVVMLTFTGVLAGQTYQLTEDKLDLIAQYTSDDQVTVLNSTAIALSYKPIAEDYLTLENATGSSLALTMFTIDYNAGTLYLKNNTLNNTKVNATYTYGNPEIENSVKNSVISGFEGTKTAGEYLPIIVLALVTAIVMIVIFVSMGSFVGISGGGRIL